MKVTVLGASGGTGRALTDELLRRGHAPTAVNRRGDVAVPAGVPVMAADLTSPGDAMRACAGADVVVMAAQPPYHHWISTWPPMLANVIDGATAAGAKIVLVDNLYAYAPATAPLTEASPEHATDTKGMLRRRLGETLLAAHARGQVRATIGRFSDYYGPQGSHSGLMMTGIGPALRGFTPRGLYDLDQPHTFHYLPDAARAFATLVERPEADGAVWILPAAPPITQRALLSMVNAEIGRRRRVGRISLNAMRVAGLFSPLLREAKSTIVQYDRPWVVDATRFQQTFGPLETTPHERAVAETVAWMRASAGGRSAARAVAA